MPSMILRKSPKCREASALLPSLPSDAAVASVLISTMTAFRFVLTFSIVSLMKAFLPGNFSSSASKFPLPNSAMQAIAFFFTAMCPNTMSLTPCAMTR